MRHVEFLGVPGSGKSTVAAAALAHLGDAAVDLEAAVFATIASQGTDAVARGVARVVRTAANPLWARAYARSTDRFSALTRFINHHPRTMEAVVAAQIARADRDLRQEVTLEWILNLMARFQLAVEGMATGAADLVIDEGFGQRAVALFGHGFAPEDREMLAAYMEAVPRPDVVVMVEAPLPECRRRLDERGWSQRLAGSDPAAKQDFLAGSTGVVDLVGSLLDDMDVELIRVDGTDSVELAATEIASSLQG